MTLMLDLPAALASKLQQMHTSLARAFMEAFAVQGYREGKLSTKEVRLLLGHASRWETEDFLAAHDAWPGISASEAVTENQRLSALLAR